MKEKTSRKNTTHRKDSRFAGQQLLLAFFSLLKTARIHKDNNIILIKNLKKFRIALNYLFQRNTKLEFRIIAGFFYMNGEKLHYQQKLTTHFKNIIVFFVEHWIDGLSLYPEIQSATDKHILSFVRIIHHSIIHENPNEWIKNKLDSPVYEWVEIIDGLQTDSLTAFLGDEIRRPKSLPDEEQTLFHRFESKHKSAKKKTSSTFTKKNKEQNRRKATAIYSNIMLALNDVSKTFSTRRQTGIGQSVRLVQGMVNMIMNDDYVLLGLSTLRNYDDYTYTHSVNVAILSIHLGHRIGLSRYSLERLGLGALFHDLGKIDLPLDILNKPGRLDNKEYAELKKHPMNSVSRIVRLRTTANKKAKIITAPFEHHLKYNLSGYPQTSRKRPLSLFGSIVAIADNYDAVTSPRIYRKSAISPDRALGTMCNQAGKDFDPILLKVFIDMLGIYPVGTIIKLNTGEIGIVTGYNSRAEEEEKWLRIILLLPDPKGGFRKGDSLNIGSYSEENCDYPKKVIGSYHPSEFGIQPAEFFYPVN